MRHHGETVEADIALDPLAEQSPPLPPPHRGRAAQPSPSAQRPTRSASPPACSASLASPGRRVPPPGSPTSTTAPSAARPSSAPAPPTPPSSASRAPNRALALTTDCTPRYCAADSRAGGALAVIEAWRNITATGATPLAITDNLNFGNPENPVVMGQFAAAVAGMAEACAALDFPVVSGNVPSTTKPAAPTASPAPSSPPPPSAASASSRPRPAPPASPSPPARP